MAVSVALSSRYEAIRSKIPKRRRYQRKCREGLLAALLLRNDRKLVANAWKLLEPVSNFVTRTARELASQQKKQESEREPEIRQGQYTLTSRHGV
jgi:hypothetical protein